MRNQEKMQDIIKALPPELKKEVEDFARFLGWSTERVSGSVYISGTSKKGDGMARRLINVSSRY